MLLPSSRRSSSQCRCGHCTAWGSARFLGAVSEDVFGQLLLQVLTDNHVDTQYVPVVKGAATAIALVTLHALGQRQFTFFRQGSADSQLQAEHLNWDAWHDVAIYHVGGVLLSTEPARSATLVAMDHTRRVGSIVSFDVNIRPVLGVPTFFAPKIPRYNPINW
jgi:fructokinase